MADSLTMGPGPQALLLTGESCAGLQKPILHPIALSPPKRQALRRQPPFDPSGRDPPGPMAMCLSGHAGDAGSDRRASRRGPLAAFLHRLE
jgi:hypothetical protein